MKRRLFGATLLALVLGVLVGLWLGPEAAPFGQLGKLVVRMLKAVAVPLLFFAILDGILSSQLSGRGVRRLISIAAINASLALLIGIGLNAWLKPGQHLSLGGLPNGSPLPSQVKAPPSWTEALGSFVPESIAAPFVEGSTMGVILLATLLGLALRAVTHPRESHEVSSLAGIVRSVRTLLSAHIKIIEWLVILVPIAVFGSVAQSFGTHGLDYVRSLGIYLAVCLTGFLLHIIFVYQSWVLAHPRISLHSFWAAAKDPLLYAFGVNSSLATMPITLSALKRLGVSDEAARLSACVGTNFNNDGILLYEVAAGMMLAQAMGLDMGLKQQVLLAGGAMIATIGVSGFPEAGLIALTLVLSLFGIPPETIVSLLAVDWIMGRFRSATNILGDMTVAIGIDRGLAPPSL